MKSLLLSLWVGVLFSMLGHAQVNVLTANGNNDRTNANLQETTLSPSLVGPETFGKLGSFPVDGQVYSQPLLVSGLQIPGLGTRNVLFVTTMHNSVYAFDADAVAPVKVLWQATLGTPVPALLLYGPYGDITPDVGILSTGAIDVKRGVLYVVAEVLQGGRPAFYLHALDLATGFERLNGPVAISGSVAGTGSGSRGDGTLPFDAMQHIQRPALLLANNSLYVAFGSHGDQGSYHGWLLTYDASDLRRQTGAYASTPDGNGGAIWQSGRGPAADRQGNIYAVNANGDYDGVRNFGQTFVKLNAAGTTTLDSYTPADWKEMSDNDFDLSAGPALISGTHIFIGADKMGNLYAMDGDAMNAPGHTSVVSASEESIFNFAVWSSGSSARVYTQGGREPLKCFQVTPEGITPEPLNTAASPIPYGRIGMSLSANGDLPGSGIVWQSAGNYNESSTPGALYAYDAGSLDLLWSSDMNPARDRMPPVSKFVAPTVANGRVYVASSADVVTVYGLFSPPLGDPGTQPSVTTVTNAASYREGVVSPGELVAVFGSSVGPAASAGLQLDGNGYVTTTLAGAQVLFDGVPSAMVFAGADQLNAVVPFGISGPTTLVQVLYAGFASPALEVSVASAAIGVFSADSSGAGQAAALNQDGNINSGNNPASPGSVVTVWATGVGELAPGGVDGAVSDAGSLPRPVAPVLAFIDGEPAEVLYAGGAPGFVQGVIQVNVRIPSGTATGAKTLLLRVGDSESQAGLTVAVSGS